MKKSATEAYRLLVERYYEAVLNKRNSRELKGSIRLRTVNNIMAKKIAAVDKNGEVEALLPKARRTQQIIQT